MKTPSQRLRAALYLIWWKNGGKGDFESYYRLKMDWIIERVKAKL